MQVKVGMHTVAVTMKKTEKVMGRPALERMIREDFLEEMLQLEKLCSGLGKDVLGRGNSPCGYLSWQRTWSEAGPTYRK